MGSLLSINERLEVTKEGMMELGSLEKQMWRLILSNLKFSELGKVSSVCKGFLFLLKEDEIFWMIRSKRKQQKKGMSVFQLPTEFDSWKSFYMENFRGYWRENNYFTINNKKEDRVIVRKQLENTWWKPVLTKKELKEGLLYPFQILKIDKIVDLVIGVATKKTDLFFDYPYGVDQFRWGCLMTGKLLFKCHNSKFDENFQRESVKNNTSVFVLVHKGSYSDSSDTLARVSFFIKNTSEKNIRFLFSFDTIPLSKGEKLYGCVSSFVSDYQVKICKSIHPEYVFHEV